MMLVDLDLSDQSLVSRLTELAAREREVIADFIVYLAEFDQRRLYLSAGFPSLFAWLTDHLRLSKASAFRRVAAARLHARMPAVTSYLRDGRVSLTKVCLLRDVLTPENCIELIEKAAGMTEKAVEELALQLDPERAAVPPRESIRLLPPPPAPAQPPARGSVAEPACVVAPAVPPPPPAAPPPQRHVIKMTVGAGFIASLDEVRAAMSHTHPGASLETLLGECMTLALAALHKRARAETDRPRAARSAPSAGKRHVAADVRRAVWKRDAGRCTFVSADGRRCDATHRLELHHVVPFARGGLATIDNLRLTCKAHNDLLARADYGDEHMNHFTRQARPRPVGPLAGQRAGHHEANHQTMFDLT